MSEEHIGKESGMNEKKETIHLTFDDRLFELLSKDLYKDKNSYLRELTQNSIDAGATEISWEVDYDNRTLTEIDNRTEVRRGRHSSNCLLAENGEHRRIH
jgi:HSP90 family molecular chaperone